MRLLTCALLAAWSAAGVSTAQTDVVQPPGAPEVVELGHPETASTAELEKRIQRLEALVETQNAATQSAAIVQPSLVAPPVQATVVVDNSWRYKRHNGSWWYWLPSKRWVVWSNNRWIDYDPATYATQVYRAPIYSGNIGYGYRHSTGYHAPHVGVGVYLGGGHGHGGHVGHSTHSHNHGGGHGGHGSHGGGGHRH